MPAEIVLRAQEPDGRLGRAGRAIDLRLRMPGGGPSARGHPTIPADGLTIGPSGGDGDIRGCMPRSPGIPCGRHHPYPAPRSGISLPRAPKFRVSFLRRSVVVCRFRDFHPSGALCRTRRDDVRQITIGRSGHENHRALVAGLCRRRGAWRLFWNGYLCISGFRSAHK